MSNNNDSTTTTSTSPDTSASSVSSKNNSTMGQMATQNETLPPMSMSKQATSSTFTKTFKKTFWHYVGNNMDRETITLQNHDHEPISILYDVGGQIIPYTNSRIAMTPQDWWEVQQNASAFRVLSHKFELSDYTPMQERPNIQDRSRVETNFVKDPPLYIYTDPNRYFKEHSLEPVNLGESIYDVNNRFRTAMPENQKDGQLKRVAINMGPEFTNSLIDGLNIQELKGCLSEWDGMLEISRITPGQSFEYGTDYESAKCRWYPMKKFNTTNHMANSNGNLYTARFAPTKTGYIEANIETGANHNFLDKPKWCLVKRNTQQYR
ncbi:hypothetical protein ACF0H5_018258 [Mactra antiquata]